MSQKTILKWHMLKLTINLPIVVAISIPKQLKFRQIRLFDPEFSTIDELNYAYLSLELFRLLHYPEAQIVAQCMD